MSCINNLYSLCNGMFSLFLPLLVQLYVPADFVRVGGGVDVMWVGDSDCVDVMWVGDDDADGVAGGVDVMWIGDSVDGGVDVMLVGDVT